MTIDSGQLYVPSVYEIDLEASKMRDCEAIRIYECYERKHLY